MAVAGEVTLTGNELENKFEAVVPAPTLVAAEVRRKNSASRLV